jgi:transcription antitermination factor NusA-like protein
LAERPEIRGPEDTGGISVECTVEDRGPAAVPYNQNFLSMGLAWARLKLAPKLPICNFDAKTGILCANCEGRLRRGEISRADVEASKVVAHLAEKMPELSRVALRRAFEAGGSYVLEFEQSDLGQLRSNPGLHVELEGALKGKVWIVGAATSDRRFLEDVFFPAKVLTVNTVWLPDGGKKTKVIVPGKRNERRIGDFDKLRDAVKQARGIELLVETEREAGLRQYG